MSSWPSRFVKLLKSRMERDTLYATAEYWDAKAKDYHGHAISMWPNNHLNHLYHNEQIGLLLRIMSPIGPIRILDLGCGTGRISRFMAGHGARVTGVDFSEKTVAIARSMTNPNNLSFRIQSMYELNDSAEYDWIITFASITVACKNEEDLAKVLLRVYRALKPGGHAIFMEPIHKGPLHRVLNMSLSAFKQCLVKIGFQIEAVHQMHFWPCRLLLAFIPWPAWFTSVVYQMGQLLMNLPFLSKMGDYKVIVGSSRR